MNALVVQASTENSETFVGPTYSKIWDGTLEMIDDPHTGWLFVVILRHLNRYENLLKMSIAALAKYSSMSERTVIRCTKILEKLGLIRVKRVKKRGRNKINEYQVLGIAAQVACFNGKPASDKVTESHQTPEIVTESHPKAPEIVTESHQTPEIVTESHPKAPEIVTESHLKAPEIVTESHTLTKEKTDKAVKTNAVVNNTVVVGTEFSIPTVKAEDLAAWIRDYGLEQVKAMYAYAQTRKPTNLGGFMYKGLKAGWKIPTVSATEPVDEPAVEVAENSAASREEWAAFSAEYGDILGSPQPEPELPLPEGVREPTEQELAWWESAGYQLELQLNKDHYGLWVKPLKFLGADADGYVFMARTAYGRDMAQHRLYRNIYQVLTDVSGKASPFRVIAAPERPPRFLNLPIPRLQSSSEGTVQKSNS